MLKKKISNINNYKVNNNNNLIKIKSKIKKIIILLIQKMEILNKINKYKIIIIWVKE